MFLLCGRYISLYILVSKVRSFDHVFGQITTWQDRPDDIKIRMAVECPAQGLRENMGLLPCDTNCETCPYNPARMGPFPIISQSPLAQLNLNRDYATVPVPHREDEDAKVLAAIRSIQINTQPGGWHFLRIGYKIAGIWKGKESST